MTNEQDPSERTRAELVAENDTLIAQMGLLRAERQKLWEEYEVTRRALVEACDIATHYCGEVGEVEVGEHPTLDICITHSTRIAELRRLSRGLPTTNG